MLRVRLTVVGEGMEAEAICGLLRTEGIACDHRQTDVGAGAWEATGSGGPREILVAPSDLERAQELIKPNTSQVTGCHTEQHHVSRILRKLRARDRVQLVVIAYQAGLVLP